MNNWTCFGNVFERIRNEYVEDVDTSDLIAAAIKRYADLA